ncbi:hypothetical protein MTO96_028960 [Rhipicephalus appendiculatus]
MCSPFVAVQPAHSKCAVELWPQPSIASSSVRLVLALDRAEAMWNRGDGEGVVLHVEEDSARSEHRPPLKAAAAIAPSPRAPHGRKGDNQIVTPCINNEPRGQPL